MDWIHPEDGGLDHEGYHIGVLPDGSVPTYPIGTRLRQRPWWGGWGGGSRENVPDAPPTALRPMCVCGWNGVDVPIDPTSDGGWRHTEKPMRAQWAAHADQAMAVKTCGATASQTSPNLDSPPPA